MGMGPSPPAQLDAPPPPPRMTDVAIIAARQRAKAKLRSRAGYRSTILTSTTGAQKGARAKQSLLGGGPSLLGT